MTDPCNALLFAPGPHTQGLSTPDDYTICEEETGSWLDRLADLVKRYGPGILSLLSGHYTSTSTGAIVNQPPGPVDPTNPGGGTVTITPTVPEEDVDRVAKQCDEYPYFASIEGGPGVSPTPSLRVIAKSDNVDEGNARGLGGFVNWCKPTTAVGGVGGSPFLVLPMTWSGAPTTLWSCGPDRWESP